MREFKNGLKEGVPIALGYLSVSFTFGLMAVQAGLYWWQAVLISLTNVTSAGQFAGLDIMVAQGTYLEMGMSQFVINLRYALMSISLSQKTDKDFGRKSRLLLGFGMTDEIFGVAASREGEVSKVYFAGLMTLPILGWTLGTLAGAVMGGVLPEMVQAAFGIAIYGMFLAIILPKARENMHFLIVIVMAVIMSCGFRYIPALNKVSSGFVIIICAVIASGIGAILFPVEQKEEVSS